jgi:hypothetical protein
VVPGFLGTDAYLAELHDWLGRLNYVPHYSEVGWNVDRPDVILEKLLEQVRRTNSKRDVG